MLLFLVVILFGVVILNVGGFVISDGFRIKGLILNDIDILI